MRIIQSFWGKPLTEDLPGRSPAGWPERRYCYMSQALSCLQLHQFHPEVELVTDQAGKQLLLEEIELPYTKVSVELDVLSPYPGDLWPIKNLYTYNLQKTPFIHVDGDVFITGPFGRTAVDAGIMVANQLHIRSRPLQEILNLIMLKLAGKPDYFTGLSSPLFSICNPGIFGGNDLAFIQTFTRDCIKLIEDNLNLLTDNLGADTHDFNLGEIKTTDLFGILFPSYMLTTFAEKHTKKVVDLLEPVEIEMVGNTHNTVASPDITHIHPIYNEKRRSVVCHQVGHRLRRYHPHYYYKIKSLLAANKI
jgi:hypothetical protein